MTINHGSTAALSAPPGRPVIGTKGASLPVRGLLRARKASSFRAGGTEGEEIKVCLHVTVSAVFYCQSMNPECSPPECKSPH